MKSQFKTKFIYLNILFIGISNSMNIHASWLKIVLNSYDDI